MHAAGEFRSYLFGFSDFAVCCSDDGVTGLRRNALNVAAFIWGLAEGTLFFFVPDVLLSLIGMQRGAKAAAIACGWAAVGAAAGGIIMFAWSVAAPEAAYAAVLAVPAVSAEMGAAAHRAMQDQGWFIATLQGPLSRTPYKLYAVIAPHVGAPLWLFAVASLIARLPRFLIVSLGCAAIAHWLGPRVSIQRLTWGLGLGWVLFYIAFFALTPG